MIEVECLENNSFTLKGQTLGRGSRVTKDGDRWTVRMLFKIYLPYGEQVDSADKVIPTIRGMVDSRTFEEINDGDLQRHIDIVDRRRWDAVEVASLSG